MAVYIVFIMIKTDFANKYCLDVRFDELSNQKKRELGLLGNTKKGKEAAKKNEARRAEYTKNVLNTELSYLTSVISALNSFLYNGRGASSSNSGRMKKIASEYNDLYSKARLLVKKAGVAYNTEYALTKGIGKDNYGKGRVV